MNIWMKSVMKMRGEVQSYYDSLLKAQGAVEKARLDLEEARREERAENRGGIYVELAAHNVKAKELILQAKKDDLKRISNKRFDLLKKSKDIRAELSRALDDDFTVNPADVDGNVMALMDSGIMNVNDVVKLYNEAKKKHNVTMMRLIGRKAETLADKETDTEARITLNNISNDSASQKKNELQSYDEYVFSVSLGTGDPESFSRNDENPVMYEYFLNETADLDGGEE